MPSASSPSAEPTRAKRGAIAIIAENHATKIDWAKVDATTDADIARHARQDVTSPLSDRTWNGLSAEGRVRAVPPAEVPAEVDVRAIREKLKLSQPEFAARFGFTAASVRQWEQGRRRPHGPARVLLTIIAKEPNAVRRALEAVEG
jgi:putative transcriptional regulator